MVDIHNQNLISFDLIVIKNEETFVGREKYTETVYDTENTNY